MSKGVFAKIRASYRHWVIDKPWQVLVLVAVMTAWAVTVIPKTTLDASADSLLLQGDPSLADFRDVSERYGAAEFLLLTWQPEGELLSDESLMPLSALANELRALPGVLSVVTALDVPLVESPRKSLSDVLGDNPLPTLSDPATDRALAIEELKNSVIYSELLASKDGTLSAIQVNLEPFTAYDQALKTREALRVVQVERNLTEPELVQLEEAELAVKAASAQAMALRSELVASVRLIAERYRQHADIFVGGVPMIASDMVAFVRSDLVVFGAAIVGVMMLVLAVVFQRARWVAIPVVTCIVTVAVVLGILAAIDWRMTVISSNFVAVLLIISLSIAIHLVVRYREIHQSNPDMLDADRIEAAMAAMAVPCLYTGLTTIVAFLSLLVSRIQPVIDFGSMMTLGIVLALIFAFTVVPAMMRVWPAGKPMVHTADQKPFTRHFARWVDERGGLILTVTAALIVTVTLGVSQLKVENRFIDYFKETTEIYQGMELLDAELGGTIGFDITLAAPEEIDLFGDLGLGGSDTETRLDDFADDDPFLEDDPFAASSEAAPFASDDDPFESDGDIFAEDDLFADGDLLSDSTGVEKTQEAGFTPSYWFSLQGRQEIAAVQKYLQSRDEVGKVMSLDTLFSTVEVLFNGPIGSVELALVQRSMPADIADLLQTPYFDAERSEARISLRVKETSKTLRRDAFLRQVKDDLINELGIEEERITMSGMLVLYNNVLQSLFASQIMTLGAVFAVILVMFYLLFRSLSLALLALAPNLLAAGLVLGIMGLANIPLDIMTITIAAIVVGMGVDNCIHYVHRFKREFVIDKSYTAAMHRCHLSIGRAMYYTTLTVVVGFSMLILSNFKPSTYFGALTAVAMIAAVLGALLLLPRLIVLLKPLGPEANHAVS